MSEADAIAKAPLPRTRGSLAHDLRQLGVQPGMVLLVHASLSSLGWVSGGPVAVLQALQDVLTWVGTLVMPAHTSDYSDPAGWRNPPVPSPWPQIIRNTMPAFDPRLTPTRGMGRIAELFRTWPDVRRSAHPQVSFAAWGLEAALITADHGLDNSLGESSPLARLYDLDGFVLLLGVGYDRNTSFHLAEYRAPGAQPLVCGAPMLENGRRVWRTYQDILSCEELFPHIGTEFEQIHPVTIGQVGSATCRLFSQRTAVDFAQNWIAEYRRR